MTVENGAARATLATIVATAAVTLAIGVTAAALGGYFVPEGSGGKGTPVPLAAPLAAEVRPAAPPSAPAVVLVPVAPDPPRGAAGSEALLVSEDHHRDRRHHEREREDEDEGEHDD
jgi:hypothetical protein